jgi:hypothetical protein
MPNNSSVLNYEPSQANPRRWRRLVKPVAVALSIVACLAPTALAIFAWITHLAWLRSGAYDRNSFPMDAFAKDLTWLSTGVVLVVAAAWCIAWWRVRRSATR